MNNSVEIIPEIPFVSWYQTESPQNVEEQIINTIINKLRPDFRQSLLKSSLKDIPDPALLKDIHGAVALFIDIIKKKKNILIVGDFDVDGITSTALLIRFFKIIDFQQYDRFIPNRFNHGYGLTGKTVDAILPKKPDLIITVDNGITAGKEIDRIKRSGIDVIVIDHHIPQDGHLPDCLIINPRQEDCAYPFKTLPGVGLVFLFLIAVRAELRRKGFWNQERKEPNLLEHLDLVAMGTIADQVPLHGLNRLFARFGLEQMTKKLHQGYPGEFFQYLQIFADKAGIQFVNSDSIAFNLAPLLNATGRMREAEEGLDFLLSDTEQEAASQYQSMERLNQKRKKKQKTMTEKATISAASLIEKGMGIVVYNNNFHEGLLGVVASRLVDQFFLPSIVVTEGESGFLKASCRSANENLMDILYECRDHLIQYGGHANAGRLQLRKRRI